VQQVVAQLPWGHNVRLLDALKVPEHRAWYARQAIEHGWSRNVLEHQIDSNLFARQGSALTNFSRTLPAEQSELAQQILKDPYTFDFLALGPEVLERDSNVVSSSICGRSSSNLARASPSSAASIILRSAVRIIISTFCSITSAYAASS
jgi:predicted nuclease of restriction endonuclease-like (RecB) superfamily